MGGIRSEWAIMLKDKFNITYASPVKGVYALRDIKTDEVLYVGSSTNIHRRCSDYYRNKLSGTESYSVKWGFEHMGEWYFDVLLIRNDVSEKELRQLEKEIQLNYKPILCKCYGDDGLCGEQNPRYGTHHTEETKIKIGAGNKGKKMIITEQARQKISKALGKQVEDIETGTIYHSTREAERVTGINSAHICLCCNGKRKTAGKHHWRYV